MDLSSETTHQFITVINLIFNLIQLLVIPILYWIWKAEKRLSRIEWTLEQCFKIHEENK